MYAIIADGGRQYRVEEGQELDIDYRESATKGDELEFGRVLAVSGEAGLTPFDRMLTDGESPAPVVLTSRSPVLASVTPVPLR